jgi:hypothetical protein
MVESEMQPEGKDNIPGLLPKAQVQQAEMVEPKIADAPPIEPAKISEQEKPVEEPASSALEIPQQAQPVPETSLSQPSAPEPSNDLTQGENTLGMRQRKKMSKKWFIPLFASAFALGVSDYLDCALASAKCDALIANTMEGARNYLTCAPPVVSPQTEILLFAFLGIMVCSVGYITLMRLLGR